MISIIICSRNKNINQDLERNIKQNIGCIFEFIVIDNSSNKYSIFESYNIGIKKSIYDILCFLHDDILIHTPNWGEILINLFLKNSSVGLIGIAGAKVKTKAPSAWWDCEENERVVYITQHDRAGRIQKNEYGFKSECETVVAIDGVFMAWKKNNHFQFNTNLKGFHNYDLNLSFETIKFKQQILVTNQINVEHFSIGNVNKSWVVSTYKIHQMYHKTLKNIYESKIDSEIKNIKHFMKIALKNQCYFIMIKIWFRLILMRPFVKFHWHFFKMILKEVLSRKF